MLLPGLNDLLWKPRSLSSGAKTALGLLLGAAIVAAALQLLTTVGMPLGTCPATFQTAAARLLILWVAAALAIWLPAWLLEFDSAPIALFWAVVALAWWAYPRLAVLLAG